jgi:hypothetical protein
LVTGTPKNLAAAAPAQICARPECLTVTGFLLTSKPWAV